MNRAWLLLAASLVAGVQGATLRAHESGAEADTLEDRGFHPTHDAGIDMELLRLWEEKDLLSGYQAVPNMMPVFAPEFERLLVDTSNSSNITANPTSVPTAVPTTPSPTTLPSSKPTSVPTPEPTPVPTSLPTSAPTTETPFPSPKPSLVPIPAPTPFPTTPVPSPLPTPGPLPELFDVEVTFELVVAFTGITASQFGSSQKDEYAANLEAVNPGMTVSNVVATDLARRRRRNLLAAGVEVSCDITVSVAQSGSSDSAEAFSSVTDAVSDYVTGGDMATALQESEAFEEISVEVDTTNFEQPTSFTETVVNLAPTPVPSPEPTSLPTPVPTTPKPTSTGDGGGSDDDEDPNLTLYLFIGLASGATILLGLWLHRHNRNVRRQKEMEAVTMGNTRLPDLTSPLTLANPGVDNFVTLGAGDYEMTAGPGGRVMHPSNIPSIEHMTASPLSLADVHNQRSLQL